MTAFPTSKVYHTIVVGGGLVGSALACALGTQRAGTVAMLDFASKAIEAPALRNEYSNRCTAIIPSSVSFFQQCGVWDKVHAQRAYPVTTMQVWDGCSDGHIRLDTKGFGDVNYLTQMVENDVLQHAMNIRLEECKPDVDVLRGCKVKGFEYRRRDSTGGFSEVATESTVSSCVAVMLEDGREILGSLVVGADGPKSAIKASGNFTETGWAYDQSAVVGTIDVVPTDDAWGDGGKGHNGANATAWQRFLPTGPVALLPLSDTVSSLVWSTTAAEARRLVALPPDDFTNELNHVLNCPSSEFLAARDADIRDNPLALGVSQVLKRMRSTVDENFASDLPKPPMALSVRERSRASFPLALANADMYVRPRVALAGDAAHKVHPLAGQGLNLGLGDARELASTIAKSHELGLDVGDIHALMAYERTRQRAVLPVMAATDFFKRVFSTSDPIVVAARSLGVTGTNALGPLKQEILRMAMNN
eukprot:m.253668 g.253668  ORF g.253668 m.253668 type:complete len:477 (+) comp19589_c0_seq4:407-1837(+)